jgi:hypothetical protein
MMNLLEEIKEDLKEAMKVRDELQLATLRLIISRVQNQEIENKKPLDGKEVISVLKREKKQRLDSIDAYGRAGRRELVERERSELKIIEKYLPATLSDDDCRKLVDQVLQEIPLETKNIGQIIGKVIALSDGRADGREVAKIVNGRING